MWSEATPTRSWMYYTYKHTAIFAGRLPRMANYAKLVGRDHYESLNCCSGMEYWNGI